MSESNLGTAVLSLRVETGPALAALRAFRAQVEGSLGTADTSALFKGVEDDARTAGQKAGRALADGIKKTTKEIKFGSFQQALDFTPKNTIKGLEEYARALRALRDNTDVAAAGTQRLTDRLGAVEQALRSARQTTAETAEAQRRLDEALNKVALQRFSESARSFSSALREQAKAAAANADQFRRVREQAEGAAKAVAGLAAKGVGEALKVPVFGLPKDVTGTFDKARAQIERLQKQAETASGKVARLSEGVAVLGAGGVAAKGVIDVLGGIGSAASNTTGILAQVQEALASLPGPLKGLGGLDDVFSSGAQAVSNWASSILQAQGELSTLAAPLEAITNSLGALGPEAVAVGGALAFTFAGFQDLIAKSFKPGIDGARAALKGITADTQALLEALARVSSAADGVASLRDLRAAEKDAADRVQSSPVGSADNLQATQDLLDVQRRIKTELQAQFLQEQRILLTEEQRARIGRQIQEAAKPSNVLALPSSEILNAEGRGIRRLSPDLGPSIDVGLQSARDFAAQLLAAAEAGQQLPPIFGQVGLSLKTLNDLAEDQTRQYRLQSDQLDEQISKQRQLRQLEADRSAEARKRLAAEADRRRQRDLSVAEFGASDIGGRLPGGGFAPGSPGARSARNSRLREAGSNALIGGAFPALFGQGLGASVGGAVGGGAGGLVGGQFGFGLSLVGTALGAQFDLATQKIQTLGSALSDPVGQLSALGEAGLISSKALEKQIQALVDTGREAEAAALIQQDLASTYGDLQSAKDLAAASDQLGRSWAQLQIAAVQLSAEPIAELLSGTASGLLFFADAIKTLRDALPESITRLFNPINAILPGATALPVVGGGSTGAGLQPTTGEGLTQQNQLLEASKQQYAELNTLAFRQAAAQAQGNKELELSLRKRQIEIQLQKSTATLNESNDPGGVRRQSLTDKAKQDIFALDEQLKTLGNGSLNDLQNKFAVLSNQSARLPANTLAFNASLQEIVNTQTRINELKKTESQRFAESIAAANQLRSIQEEIAIQQQRGDLTGTGIGALNAVKQFEDAKRAEQDAQAALRANPGSSDLLNASKLASENVKLAAAKTKADLQDAFKSAQDAVQSISRGIEDSVTALRELQNSSGGLNNFLSPQQQVNRQQAVADQLRPEANALANQLGIRLQVSGTTQQRNQQTLDFIKAARQELRLGQDIDRAQVDLGKATNDLAVVNDSLVTVNTQLTEATTALAQKDWQVNVAVNANTGEFAVNLG